jgi:hypothetical protein
MRRNLFSLMLLTATTLKTSHSLANRTTQAPSKISLTSSLRMSSSNGVGIDQDYYRTDGVRITHNPYAPGMAEKYGLPGQTDQDGFDPYADTVGPGIYGGNVKRDNNGEILVGTQYQNHNPRPGPLYDGTGYSLMSKAIHAGPETVKRVLKDFPSLKDEVSTGGARPLHMCGMSRKGQLSTQVLIDAGADLYAKDTYGYTALHRMASNNLEIGGEALVRAGMDPNQVMDGTDSTPIQIARRSRAIPFLIKMKELGHYN